MQINYYQVTRSPIHLCLLLVYRPAHQIIQFPDSDGVLSGPCYIIFVNESIFLGRFPSRNKGKISLRCTNNMSSMLGIQT